jgi:hypothetical protein
MFEQKELAAVGSLLQRIVLLVLLFCWRAIDQAIEFLPKLPTQIGSLFNIKGNLSVGKFSYSMVE